MMNVLIFNADLGYGGAEKMLAWLANILVDNNYHVTFLTYRNEKSNYQLLDSKVIRDYLPEEGATHSILSCLKTAHRLHKYLKNNYYDLAIAFLKPSQVRIKIASAFTGVKLLFSQRGDPYSIKNIHGKERVIEEVIHCFFCCGDGFVFQTEGARSFYPNRVIKKSVVIPNIVKPIKRTTVRGDHIDKTIVTVSRLEMKQKRQDLLIEAFNNISDSYPEYKLIIWGSGPDEAFLKQKASSNPRIFFKGITTNVVESIQDATMFVLTSDYEGIPNALIEAMSIGVPSISTDCSPGGARMLIENEINGLLVPRGDAKVLSDAIIRFIENEELRENCGKESVKLVDCYTEKTISEKWITFINKMINDKRIGWLRR